MVLDELAGLGPFFAVDSHEPGAAAVPPWRPASELIEPPPARTGGALAGRLDAVRAALAAQSADAARAARVPGGIVDSRVAASALHLGLVARLVSPALGSAALGAPLDLRPGGLWWQDRLGGPMPLSAPFAGFPGAGFPGAGSPGVGFRGGGDWGRWLVAEVIAPVTGAVGRLVPVSERVLWGNAASAVNAAAMQLARQRPDLAAEGWRLAREVFARPRLRHEHNPPGPGFRRSSCCLFYRLAPGPPSAVCGDCVLRRPVTDLAPGCGSGVLLRAWRTVAGLAVTSLARGEG